MMNKTPVLVGGLVVLAGLGTACAEDAPPTPSRHVYLIGTLRITQPYLDLAHGTDGPVPSHLLIENRGDAPDRLLGATVEGGPAASLVTGADQGSDAVALPPNSTLELAAGADHLALTGLGGITAASAPVTATLHFERAGFLRVGFETDRAKVAVESVGPVTPDKPVDLAQ